MDAKNKTHKYHSHTNNYLQTVESFPTELLIGGLDHFGPSGPNCLSRMQSCFGGGLYTLRLSKWTQNLKKKLGPQFGPYSIFVPDRPESVFGLDGGIHWIAPDWTKYITSVSGPFLWQLSLYKQLRTVQHLKKEFLKHFDQKMIWLSSIKFMVQLLT